MKEIGPTYYFAPPAVFESLLTTVSIRIEDASFIKRKMYHFFMKLAQRVGVGILERRTVSLSDKFLYWLGNLLVYGPLKNTLGFSRIRLAYTAGEAIGTDIFDFYRSLGINIKQLYGQTEAAVFVTIQSDDDVRADTVGPAAPQVELKIADNGEVLYRSPGVFHSYYKNEEGDPGDEDRGRLGAYRRRRTAGRRRAPAHHRPRQGRRQAQRRRHVRAQVPREQAEVLPPDRRGGHVRARAGLRSRVRQHRPRRGEQLGPSATISPTRATRSSRRTPRCTGWSGTASPG